MTKSRAIALATAITATVALGLVGGFTQLKAALAQTEGVRVASRQRFVSGRPEGEVLVGDTVVMRIRAAAGGFTATQRTERVSNRLQQVLNERQIRPEDLRVARVNGDYVVMVNNDLLITADTYHAALNRTTPQRLATIWRDNLASALSTAVAGYRGNQERAGAKIVPIASLGSGLRVGAARVAGPVSRVDETNVIGQIETSFQDVVRIRIFVPLGDVTRLERIPEVSVTAYGDIQL